MKFSQVMCIPLLISFVALMDMTVITTPTSIDKESRKCRGWIETVESDVYFGRNDYQDAQEVEVTAIKILSDAAAVKSMLDVPFHAVEPYHTTLHYST